MSTDPKVTPQSLTRLDMSVELVPIDLLHQVTWEFQNLSEEDEAWLREEVRKLREEFDE